MSTLPRVTGKRKDWHPGPAVNLIRWRLNKKVETTGDLHAAISPAGDRQGSCVHLGENLPISKTEPRATCPRPKGIHVGPSAGKVAFPPQETATAIIFSAKGGSVASYTAREEETN